MDIRQGLLAARADLQMIRAARSSMPTKVSGENAFYRRLNEAMAPSSAEMPSSVAEPSYDMLYVERLRQVLNSPQAAALDITTRGR